MAVTDRRQLHLNAFVFDIGHHEAAWRLPETDPHATVDIDHYVHAAQVAERGMLDSVFFADFLGMATDPVFRPPSKPDPTVLVAALAMMTQRIGLIATASTTYSEPYDLARSFASIDHISRGRAGWNIVTSAGDEAARNFGRDGQARHSDRYERAEEFVDVVTRLWDSWDDEAVLADQAGGRYADPSRINAIDHRGRFFRVAGPLDLPRSPQGWPVLVQAGASKTGQAFAARHAEVVFTAQREVEDGQAFRREIRDLVTAAGRAPDDVLVLPGVVPVLGSTMAEARARERELQELIIPAYGLQQLSSFFGVDLTGADLDGPLPDVPQEDAIEGVKSRSTLVADMARRDRLTVRELIKRLGGGRGHRTFVGTPEGLADDIERWFRAGAADGFNVMPATIPGDLELFVDHVVPILRSRGIFREAYTGTTLREHYGLRRPGGAARR
jgi:FMN-dependent oxidoreductase (nitrilotriacetate monooxygenase family)